MSNFIPIYVSLLEMNSILRNLLSDGLRKPPSTQEELIIETAEKKPARMLQPPLMEALFSDLGVASEATAAATEAATPTATAVTERIGVAATD